jgi:hypothetical protein
VGSAVHASALLAVAAADARRVLVDPNRSVNAVEIIVFVSY